MTVHVNPAETAFREGERQLHELGLRVIRDRIPDQYSEFPQMRRMVHLGIVDASDHPWAITRTGEAGSSQSASDNSPSAAPPREPDSLDLYSGARISVLDVETENQRRNRSNDAFGEAKAGQLRLSVDQSCGNCPRFIQIRRPVEDDSADDCAVSASKGIEDRAHQIIETTDILMLAIPVPELGDDPRAGVGRSLRVQIDQVNPTESVLPQRFVLAECSPNNPSYHLDRHP